MYANRIGYLHVFTYRKCNECGFHGNDMAFITREIVAEEDSNSKSVVLKEHCPKCNSKNLSNHFHDEELTKEVITLSFIVD